MGIPYLRMPPKELSLFLSQQEAKILLLSAHNSYIFPKEIVEKENFTIIISRLYRRKSQCKAFPALGAG